MKYEKECDNLPGRKECNVHVSNDALGGDTAPYVRKLLTIESYRSPGEFHNRRGLTLEFQTWNVECINGRIIIDGAVYGVSHAFNFVTYKAKQLFDE
jgi:hypothetical protein